MKHKTLSFLLAVLMSMVASVASAHDFEVGGIYYKITSSATPYTVSVTYQGDYYNSYDDEYTGSVTIPESVTYSGKTYSVTSIGGSAFNGCSGLTSITIGNSVTSIGYDAFYKCSGLTSITIGNSVTSIGSSAFSGCSGLTSIEIPNSVTSIGNYAFSGCSGLTSIVVENGNTTYDSRNGCNAIIETASNTLIAGCKNTIIPNSVTKIGDYAFSDCSGLTSVVIPNSVTSIGLRAFEYTSLSSITMSNNIKEIGNAAFYGCMLKNIYVKSMMPPTIYKISNGYSVVSYDNYVFSNSTYNHAMLYVPVGCWDAYAFNENDWNKFINIREAAVKENEVKSEEAYTLMNVKTFSYTVYDTVNDQLATITSIGALDESNPNHCWQTVEVNDKKYLYNIGAKKFAVPATDGRSFTLSESVGSVEMTDGTDGIVLNGHTETQWSLVRNESMNADNSMESVVVTAIEGINANDNDNRNEIYELNGRQITKPTKGIYIVNGKKLLKR